MLLKIKKFVKSVPLMGWVVVGVVLAALIIFKVSEAKGHPGYPKETPVVAPTAAPVK
jgi:hypothetical protein